MKLRAIVKKEMPGYQQYYGEIDPETVEMKEVGKIPCPNYIEIVEDVERGIQSYLILYYDKNGGFLTDSWFQTLKEAKEQARIEFDLSDDDWVVVES